MSAYGEALEKYTVDSDAWYEKARKCTFETLPSFIEEVRKEFPSYGEFPNFNKEGWFGSDEQQLGYRNGMVAGSLIGIAAYTATSNHYGWSCNQAGVVRNCLYMSFGLSEGKEYNLNQM